MAGAATEEAATEDAAEPGVGETGAGADDDEPLTMASELQAQVGEKNGLDPAYWTYVGGGAMATSVGHEHGWEIGALGKRSGFNFGNCIAFAGGRRDGDRSAVHVHLAIADLVEPCPRESVLAWIDAFWDGKLELGSTITIWVFWKIASRVDRTSTQDRVDDLPG